MAEPMNIILGIITITITGILFFVLNVLNVKYDIFKDEQIYIPKQCIDGIEYYYFDHGLTPHYRNENGNIVAVTCQEKR